MNTTPDPLKKLSAQHRKFVLAYCETFNATKAALAAGYSKKTARQQGSRLLTNVDIKAGIKSVFDKASMDPAEIAARWTALARAGLDDFFTKVEVEKTTKVEQSLVNAITDIEADIAYKYDFLVRSWEVLELAKDDRAKELLEHDKWVKFRRLDILRFEMQMEKNPAAVRVIDGPKVKVQEMQLDLVKAAELGLLDLVKSITPTKFGNAVELRSPDAAMDNLAKWQGMLTTKLDLTSGGEPIAAPPVLGLLTLEEKRRLLEGRRQQRTQEGAANA